MNYCIDDAIYYEFSDFGSRFQRTMDFKNVLEFEFVPFVMVENATESLVYSC